MKKILNISLVLAAMSFAITGCFKDRDYGTNVTEVKGIAFPQAVPLNAATLAADSVGLNIGVASQVTALTVTDLNITLEADQPASEDITVNLAINNALVPTDPALGLTKLTSSQVSIPATVVIPKGSGMVSVPITLANTSILDATVTFAIGVSITGTSSGLTIASNKRNIVVTFNIKNKYDGKYSADFKFFHATNNTGNTGLVVPVQMITSGPNSVKMFFDAAGVYGAPIFVNGGLSYFGVQEPEFTVDPITNKVTVQNVAAGAVTFYRMALDYDSRWEDATKKFFVKYGYNYNADGTFNPAAQREWTFILTYTGPR